VPPYKNMRLGKQFDLMCAVKLRVVILVCYIICSQNIKMSRERAKLQANEFLLALADRGGKDLWNKCLLSSERFFILAFNRKQTK